ncbi:DUF3307 domain-containing protein [Nocardiopsis sp. YSL2]|uniref:DUF3307 domain-containing protein n=1 Tax=Nocardiopsis sp. YSL2 TaxID=2939492 RepID=UPI0026F44FAC|nr:DUF3307 domain-containing protein [Nocardiopsis sp. YSL2]
MQHADITVLGGLALPLLAAHLLADHPFQLSAWAAAKGGCDHSGRIACAKHVAVVAIAQGLAVLLVLAATGLAVDPLAFVAFVVFTVWSHYWFDRRFTAAGLYEAIGKTGFATLGTPRPGHDDAPHLGTGAYRMDQDWHHLWLAIGALMLASTGVLLAVLTVAATALMAAAILASRAGRRTLAQQA